MVFHPTHSHHLQRHRVKVVLVVGLPGLMLHWHAVNAPPEATETLEDPVEVKVDEKALSAEAQVSEAVPLGE